MPLKKKGVSPLIATVLLIGFAVALGSIVTIWMKEQAKKSVGIVTEDVEYDIRCSDVSFNAYFTSGCDNINISNKGVRRIIELKIRSEFGMNEYPIDLVPEQTKSLNILTNVSIEIIPVITGENKKISCADRKVMLTC